MELIPKAQLFFKRNGSTILTCIGAAGVIATAVTAVKATPKAVTLLEKAEKVKGEKLSTIETIKVAGPAYIPSVAIGASTIACIFGANVLNKRTQASIASAYALLDNAYKEYKQKVKDVFGEEQAQAVVQGLASDRYDEDADDEDGTELFFDSFSLRFFRSTLDEVRKAEEHMNRVLQTRGYVGYNEFYETQGLAAKDEDYEIGWSAFTGDYFYGYNEIRFECVPANMTDGKEYYIVEMPFEPTGDFMFP